MKGPPIRRAPGHFGANHIWIIWKMCRDLHFEVIQQSCPKNDGVK